METYSGIVNPAVGVPYMSKLQSFGRPYVEFDVQNKEHRKHFARYLKTNAWGECPYRFYLTGHLMPEVAIRNQLLDYYCNKEFGKRKG